MFMNALFLQSGRHSNTPVAFVVRREMFISVVWELGGVGLMDAAQFFIEKSRKVEKRIGEIVPRDSKPWEVYGPIWDLLDRGGKRLRPAMCLLSCEAMGGDEEEALGAAAAIEMFHNFTLIHDDIEDGSKMRRGKPCLHVEYGVPIALNAGDGLFMMVWRAALQVAAKDAKKNLEVQRILLDSFTMVLEGQAIELGWYRKNAWDVRREDYVRMVQGKTGALIAASCATGAYLGGANRRQVASFYKFGMDVGVAFQIQDDVLNIVGDEKKYRKEIGGDIIEGKRTLIVIEALKRLGPVDSKRLVGLLGSGSGKERDVEEAIALLKKSGGVRKAQEEADVLITGAKKEIGKVVGQKQKKVFEEIADYLVRRDV